MPGLLRTASGIVLLLLVGGCATQPPTRTDTAAAQPGAPQQDRLLPLEGGQNFRDLGGYPAADGKTVKWRTLYRSGSMQDLTASDLGYLSRLGIRTVCDFRSTAERQRHPVNWPAEGAPHVLSRDYVLVLDALMGPLKDPAIDVPRARAAMESFYAELPFTFADDYRAMFGELLAGRAPLAFNCSAGKDRTGVAAALLLTALGVPRAVVTQDYLLSARHYRYVESQQDPKEAAFWASLPPGVMHAITGVDQAYLDAAFRAIEARPGGLNGYFRQQLGLGADELALLRSLYLE